MPATLKRCLSPSLITFYGLGTIPGAGISVLVREAAATALYTPLDQFITLVLSIPLHQARWR